MQDDFRHVNDTVLVAPVFHDSEHLLGALVHYGHKTLNPRRTGFQRRRRHQPHESCLRFSAERAGPGFTPNVMNIAFWRKEQATDWRTPRAVRVTLVHALRRCVDRMHSLCGSN